MRLFEKLDVYGITDPDFNEGHYTDRCPVCAWPVRDHPVRGGDQARWAHRRAALFDMITDWGWRR